jgi:hypothetical protein
LPLEIFRTFPKSPAAERLGLGTGVGGTADIPRIHVAQPRMWL